MGRRRGGLSSLPRACRCRSVPPWGRRRRGERSASRSRGSAGRPSPGAAAAPYLCLAASFSWHSGAGIPREGVRGAAVSPRSALGSCRPRSSRVAHLPPGPGVLRTPGGLRPPRPLPVAVLGVQLQEALPPPPPTKDKFIFHVLSAAAERLGVGGVPPPPGGCRGGRPRSGKKSLLSSGQRRIMSGIQVITKITLNY